MLEHCDGGLHRVYRTSMFERLSVMRLRSSMRSVILFSIACLLTLLVGCGSNDVKEDEELEPAELLDFEPSVGLRKLWSRGIGEGQGKYKNRLEPVVLGDKLYVASIDGRVVALERDTGRVAWREKTDLPISGGVGYDNERLYLGTDQGDVLALQQSDGAELWKKRLSSEVLSAPTALNDLLVVRTFDGRIYGLNATDGEQRWVHDGTLPVLTMRGSSRAVFYEGLVIAGTANGKLIALDAETGQLVWERRVAIAQGRSEIERIVDVDSTPLLSGDLVYVVSYQGRLVAFQAMNGAPVWRQEESSFNDITEGYGNVYVSAANSTVSAYQKRNGRLRWEQPELARRQLTAAVPIKRYVTVSDFEGYVHLLSQVDGSMVGRTLADGKGVRASSVVWEDMLFVYGNSGRLTAYRLSDNPRAGFASGAAVRNHHKIWPPERLKN